MKFTNFTVKFLTKIEFMKKLIFTILFFHFCYIIYSQSEWKIYCNGEIINSLSQDSVNIIAGTAGGGMVIVNKTTLSPTFIKKGANSIPSNQVNFVAGSLYSEKKWAATNKGFSFYLPDSNKWVLYNHDNIPEIPLNRVTSVAGTNTDIFIGCDSYFDDFLNSWVYGGIARYNNTHGWTSDFGASDIHSIRVRCLAISPNNDKLFVGTMFGNAPPSGGFSYYNIPDSTWTHVYTGNSLLPSDDINYIYFDSWNSSVIVCTEDGLAEHIGWDTLNEMNHWTVLDTSNSNLPDNHVTCVASQYTTTPVHQYWWVGTRFGGLFKRDTYDGSWAVYDTSNSNIGSNNITSICVEYENPEIVWIGTDNGLYRFDQTTFTKATTSEWPIPSNYINDIEISNSNTKWIATSNSLTKLDNSNWTVYNPENSGLKYYGVYSVYLQNNDLWIGSSNIIDGPLCKFDGTNWKYFLGNYSFLHSVYDITSDANGDRWIASDYGVFKNIDTNFVNWNATTNYPAALPSNYVTSIISDKDNVTWISTNNGLANNSVYWPWEVYSPANSQIPSYTTYAVIQDDSSFFWIATDKGLAKYDSPNNIWTLYDTNSVNFPSMTIYDVDYEGDSLIWIASRRGFSSLDRVTNQWTNYNSDNSELTEDIINKIKVDPWGNKWICTKAGGLLEFKKGGIASGITEFNSSNNDFNIIAYPNPANDRIFVHIINSIKGDVTIKIFTTNGQIIRKYKQTVNTSQDIEIDTTNLDNGIYFLSISNNKDINISHRFVINK